VDVLMPVVEIYFVSGCLYVCLCVWIDEVGNYGGE
jgi:hypothetical protein